jgi:hypothetical protein
VQTPLSDEPAEDSADDEDCEEDESADFAELLDAPADDDSATFSEDELGTFFAELLTATAELELTFAELDEASELELDSKLNGYGSSLT